MNQASIRHTLRRPLGGFTLVELLVVITIIAVLLGLMLSGIVAARALSQRTACLNNLREIGLSTQVYTLEHEKYPRAWVNDTCRWMDLLKPYLSKKSRVYQCPADFESVPLSWDPEITVSYGMNVFRFADDSHCFWYTVGMDAVRSPGQVILFADCKPGKYYCGGGGRFQEPVPSVAYRHMNNTFNVIYCDGHGEVRSDTVQDDWDASR